MAAFVLALVGSLSLSLAAAESLARGHLVLEKVLDAPSTRDVLVKDSPFNVKYTILNVGEGDATDISLSDAFPEEMFTLVSGSTNLQLARLDAGANHSATAVLIPRVAGHMTVGRAELTYTYTTADGEATEAKTSSSTPGRTEIYSRAVYEMEAADHSLSVGAAFAVALALILGPYAMYQSASATGQAGGQQAGGKKSA